MQVHSADHAPQSDDNLIADILLFHAFFTRQYFVP
jgi:hypothetical protein